jgi:hypothetical protein
MYSRCNGGHKFHWSWIGFLFMMFMIFGGFKLFLFVWPLWLFLPFMFWFSRHKSRWNEQHWDDIDVENNSDWAKPKRKNDELYEKPKRQGESDIYYF